MMLSDAKPEDWQGVRAAIFDVDGTLYHQKPVRIRMAIRLGEYFLLRPWKWGELMGIFHFRRVREEEKFRVSSLESQVLEAARRARGMTEERLQKAIARWMFQEPLPLISKFANQETVSLLQRVQAEGKRVIIYSDYAPEEKLKALNIVPDAIYYPGLPGVEELKPSRRVMEYLMAAERLSPSETVFIGDRPEKDGKSAEMAGMRYFQVQR